MNNRDKILSGSAAAAVMAGIALAYVNKKKQQDLPSLEVAENVDLDKYLGEWYEIARLPTSFEKNCYATKAIYSKNTDGTIIVENMCHKGDVEGPVKSVKGKAYVAEEGNNAKLKVQFFWPFKGDYWILDLEKNYEYALVGEPSRKNMWILSRTPRIELNALQLLIKKATEKGFDIQKLIYTEQGGQ